MFFDLKPDELKCLPHCLTMNAYNPEMPQRNYRWDDCGKLAFHKEPMLVGISQENEEEFFAKEKKLFAGKQANGRATDSHSSCNDANTLR